MVDTLLVCSILDKCGQMWKKQLFFRAATVKYCTGGYGRIVIERVTMKYFFSRMAGLIIVLAVGLGDVQVPLPSWNRKRGFHIARYPLLRMFSVSIFIIKIMTARGGFPQLI